MKLKEFIYFMLDTVEEKVGHEKLKQILQDYCNDVPLTNEEMSDPDSEDDEDIKAIEVLMGDPESDLVK